MCPIQSQKVILSLPALLLCQCERPNNIIHTDEQELMRAVFSLIRSSHACVESKLTRMLPRDLCHAPLWGQFIIYCSFTHPGDRTGSKTVQKRVT